MAEQYTQELEPKTEQEQALSLEQSFSRMEELLEILEKRETTLEESFQAYREGMALIQSCNEKIDRVEKKMKIIDKDGELREF